MRSSLRVFLLITCLLSFRAGYDNAPATGTGEAVLMIVTEDELTEKMFFPLAVTGLFRQERSGPVRDSNGKEKVFGRWLVFSLFILVSGSLFFFFFSHYRCKRRMTEKYRDSLRERKKEMEVLRRVVDDCESLLPYKNTVKREEVRMFLRNVLSERELDVFMLLLKGFTNRKIAKRLFVSVNTVKFHLQNIYVKLDVNNRAKAVLMIQGMNGR